MNTSVVPYPCDTLERWERLIGLDVPRLSDASLWAERTMLAQALAEQVLKRRRDRLIVIGLDVLRESEWMRDRLKALAVEQERRAPTRRAVRSAHRG